MALRNLFDHTALIRRPVETRVAGGDVEVTHGVTATIRCALVPPNPQLTDWGPGEQSTDRMEGYAGPEADIRPRDVLEIIAGPEAVSAWKVQGVRHPRGHHVEFVCERTEVEPEAESSDPDYDTQDRLNEAAWET